MYKTKNKLILDKCEIEGCNVSECLQLHHIIERTDIETSNHPMNLCILCPNHHNFLHDGKLKIIGIIPSTKLPNKRTIIYEINGKRNVDILDDEIPKYNLRHKGYKLFLKENKE
jgi:hypothetical protein